MPEKISILKESGETLVSNIVSIFTIPETEKRYIITTENAVDPHGLTVLHVSEIIDGTMQKIATDEEWSSIKTIMRAIISGNVGSYKYLPLVSNLKATAQYSRDISVSASASKQMIDNYNSGEKSAIEPVVENAQAGVAQTVPQPPAQPAVDSSTIFPSDGTVVSNDDEVVPGIAVLSQPVANGQVPVQEPMASAPAPAPMPAQPVPTPVPVAQTIPAPAVPEPQIITQPTPALVPETNVIPTPTPVAVPGVQAEPVPVAAPYQPEVVQPVNTMPPVGEMAQAPVPQAVPQPVPAQEPMGVAQPGMNNPVNVAVTPVIDAQVNPPVELSNEVQVAPQVQTDNLAMNNNVQVAVPTTVVPDAQIVQNAQNTSLTNDTQINFNATPSFDPNATLDEVVVAAQQMFMDGVKNLVVTIQEKVYRDLYSKEEELKNRESAVAQKERELGIAPAASVTPPVAQVTTQQEQVPVAVTNEVPAPVIQPTIVQAANDTI